MGKKARIQTGSHKVHPKGKPKYTGYAAVNSQVDKSDVTKGRINSKNCLNQYLKRSRKFVSWTSTNKLNKLLTMTPI